jgi:ribokinase
MKLLDFGSLNIDHTYQLPHLVKNGETLSSTQYQRSEGGKGFNQAVALAKAGREVFFAGAVGPDGKFLQKYLNTLHINTDYLQVLDAPTGHAIIQLDAAGQNSIILFGGTNVTISRKMIDETLAHFACGDYILLQNEISHGEYLIHAAHAKGMHVILNPSPFSPELLSWPLEKVEWLILNEIEGCDITGRSVPNEMLDELLRRFPQCHVVLTLGAEGSVYADADQRIHQAAIWTEAVDTTAAGDTFTGYFVHEMLKGEAIQSSLKTASYASSIAVSRHGASRSVPQMEEVLAAMKAADHD